MSEQTPKILMVGHCRPDEFAMRMALRRFAPGAEFVGARTDADFAAHADADAFLVNRVLDGRFSNDSGLDLLAAMDPDARARAALVSNFDDAQAQAEKLGALPGFGKSEMHGRRAQACLEALLGARE